jgi:hypothetical protein
MDRQELELALRELIADIQHTGALLDKWEREHHYQLADGRKNRAFLHPLGAGNFATAAKCLGNQIIDVGVKVRDTLLRCTMTVRMRRCMRMQR